MPPKPSTVMCAWCGRHISGPLETDDASEYPEGYQNRVSHGICKECKKAQDAEVARLKKARGKL